uniref:Exocyst complex component 3-like protein 2 n=1 Tax=Denticeps clupeoides TaxID=299321 RepID=A0AAY4C5D0_9TELE
MPILKKLPMLAKGCHSNGELIFPSLNPFDEKDQQLDVQETKGATEESVSRGGRPLKGTLERICSSAPLRTLGKLGKGLRVGGRSVWGGSATLPAGGDKRKHTRRSSEEIMNLIRFRCETMGREPIPRGEVTTDDDEDSDRRRPSFLRLVSKLGRESLLDSTSQEAEEEAMEELPVMKRREPLSVLEILQLINHRDLLLADTHIQELERECDPVQTNPPPYSPCGPMDDLASPSLWDSGRRKAKDVELLYEALQREMWDVVRESLRQPRAGPQLGLVVLLIQQEEQADAAWALREATRPDGDQSEWARPRRRPRRLRQRWADAVGEAADWSLPQPGGDAAGELALFLERLRGRIVEDLDAARRNVVGIYPEDFGAFQVYLQSYHRAAARRLKTVTGVQLQITDTYALLDWVYNIYSRDVLGTIGTMAPIDSTQLEPLLPPECVDELEQDCVSVVKEKLSSELSQVLEEEELSWAQTLHIEDYQCNLARSVIQRLKVDLDRSTAVTPLLGARVARCTLTGLSDFLYSFKRKVELFHETQSDFGDRGDGYVSKTIALVNCIPPFRSFVERCHQCDPLGSPDSLHRARSSLDRIVNQSIRVLTDRLFEHIRPFFDKLVKRKWLTCTEPYENIETAIKQHFKKLRRMDCPPYQVLVSEVHRRVMVEYVRALMRGRVICTSLKMRKRLAYRLQDEAKQLKVLFKDLESDCCWLDSVLMHLADVILLEDTPSIQMEVAILMKDFPDLRRRHVSAVLNVRGMVQQAQRQEILGVVRDLELGDGATQVPRERALFAEIPVTSELPCLGLALMRMALTASSWVSSARPNRRRRAHLGPQRMTHDDHAVSFIPIIYNLII